MTHSKSSRFTLIAIATLATAMLIAFVPNAAAQDALAQVPMGRITSTTVPGILQLQDIPLAADENAPISTSRNTLAAGYNVNGTGFIEITGSWVVPTVKCTSTTPVYILTGMAGSSTAQTVGMVFGCVGIGAKPTYEAYYEFSPYNKNLVAITTFIPKPGDNISTIVAYVSNGQYSVTIEDVTQGKTFTKVSPALKGTDTYAGWQVQAQPGKPLPTFTSIAMGYDYTAVADSNWAVDSFAIGPLGDFGSYLEKFVRVTTLNVADLTPSALTTDGSSFKVVRNGP